MSFVSVGDLSRGFALRTQTADIKARLNRLGEEFSTGITADPAARLRGDFRALGAIERSLKVMDSYEIATKEAALTTEAMQNALGQVHDASQNLSSSLLNASNMFDARTIDVLGADAKGWFEMSVSALNVQVAGRTLFAGAATDRAALATGAEIYDDVKAAVAGLTTASDVLDAIDLWFDAPGGGFETSGYLGSASPVGAVRLNDGNSLALDVSAADPVIRDTLKDMAAAALLSDPTLFGGDVTQRTSLAARVGESLLTNSGNLTALRGEIGSAQARVESIRTENSASRQMFELARIDMLAVDQYDAASEFQAVEAQLETIYTVTARLSRLSLADYI
ncbi:flagellin [Rhodovulum euryhalinum]|uniref:Flagellar hook-associated protein 3 FlgL n=1 Tax=Rhodovulum euryhalinum TaxID=35805 RepID=A0A4R2KLB4_9RHOB|nr:flagellin [Rhodovulum euryhalinum]TCO73382.1 flagellar hook-associated protein 3 FlgL [Rhodovulum euryhalinum]